jgi:hypothetical protein
VAVSIVPFGEAHVEPAAKLLAARHREIELGRLISHRGSRIQPRPVMFCGNSTRRMAWKG